MARVLISNSVHRIIPNIHVLNAPPINIIIAKTNQAPEFQVYDVSVCQMVQLYTSSRFRIIGRPYFGLNINRSLGAWT
jgi:hypothetical protein